MGLDKFTTYKKFWEDLIISLIAPKLESLGLNASGVEEFLTDDDQKIVFDDAENIYIVNDPWIKISSEYIYTNIETEEEFKCYNGKFRPAPVEAGFGSVIKILGKFLRGGAHIVARIKNISSKKVLTFNRKTKKWDIAAGVGTMGLLAYGLSLGGQVAKDVGIASLLLITNKMFANFICEESEAAGSFPCYIASHDSIPSDVLASAIQNFEGIIPICDSVYDFGDSIPILHELQTPFRAFKDMMHDSLDVWKAKLVVKQKKEKMNMTSKKIAIVYIFTNVPGKIYIDGIYAKQYAPAQVKVEVGTRKIKITAVGYNDYIEEISLVEYEIKNIGSVEEPIQMIPETKFSIPEQKLRGKIITGKCIDITDGDTFTFLADNKISDEMVYVYQVRLYGIDAPEISHYRSKKDAGAGASSNLLSWLIEKEKISVDIRAIDKYNRVVGEIYMGGECVNLLLLRIGAVRAYPEFLEEKDLKQYKSEEQEAKEGNKGIWGYPIKLSPCSEMYEIKGVNDPCKDKERKKAEKEAEKKAKEEQKTL